MRVETLIARVEGPALDRHPAILEGAAIIREGGLVAFPTETVYGLGADASSVAAVDRIFQAKKRPPDNPVIVHVAELRDLSRIGRLDAAGGRRLLERFWPGPLTVVVPALEPVRSAVCRGLETVAVRMPAHPVALALIRAAGRPLAAPSANLSGRPSPTTARHVLEDLEGRIPLILDGGQCDVGIESTVLDLSGDSAAILRPGAVGAQQIAEHLGSEVALAGSRPERSPGTRHRHYQPRAPVIAIGLDVSSIAVDRLLETLSGRLRHHRLIGYIATRRAPKASAGLQVLDRTGSGLLTRNFYRDIRHLDRRESHLIFVEAVGAGEPIMDRLSRASVCSLTRKDFDDPGLADRVLSLIPE